MSQQKKEKSLFQNKILYGIVLFFIGILLCIYKLALIKAVIVTAGAVLAVMGVLEIIAKNTVSGIMKLVGGALMIIFSLLFIEVALIIVGVFLLLSGIFKFRNAYEVQKHTDKFFNKLRVMLPSIITIIVGVLFIIARWCLADAICFVLGIFLIIDGLAFVFEIEQK